jgi:Mlc titration factor MtfA (ptsG expression regulator)
MSVLDTFRNWKRKRVLASAAIPEPLWREALETLSFVAIYTDAELARLRELTVMFLSEKSIVGGGGFEVTPVMRVAIAVQACVLILNLDPRYLDGWENVIVYPDEFMTNLEFEDEAGVVHQRRESLAGEAVLGGPVVLSWPDVQAGADWDSAGMNLVIHEFAHKLDMRSGDANGCPPLPAEMPPRSWQKAMSAAFEHFRARVEKGEETAIDPYAAESPAEFFAVLSEVFFSDPTLLLHEYPKIYELFSWFYKQDPASRTELLLEE